MARARWIGRPWASQRRKTLCSPGKSVRAPAGRARTAHPTPQAATLLSRRPCATGALRIGSLQIGRAWKRLKGPWRGQFSATTLDLLFPCWANDQDLRRLQPWRPHPPGPKPPTPAGIRRGHGSIAWGTGSLLPAAILEISSNSCSSRAGVEFAAATPYQANEPQPRNAGHQRAWTTISHCSLLDIEGTTCPVELPWPPRSFPLRPELGFSPSCKHTGPGCRSGKRLLSDAQRGLAQRPITKPKKPQNEASQPLINSCRFLQQLDRLPTAKLTALKKNFCRD